VFAWISLERPADFIAQWQEPRFARCAAGFSVKRLGGRVVAPTPLAERRQRRAAEKSISRCLRLYCLDDTRNNWRRRSGEFAKNGFAVAAEGGRSRTSPVFRQVSAPVSERPVQWGKVDICREPHAGHMKLRPFSISGRGVEGSSDKVSKAMGVECRHIGLEQVTKKPGTPCD
jgi:hypothetical protein